MRFSYLTSAMVVFSVSLAGCRVAPQYARPAVAPPPAYSGVNHAPAVVVPTPRDTKTLGDLKWSEVFHDSTLRALIQEALANNDDVKIAADRVLEQQDLAGIARSQQLPTVSGGGSSTAIVLPDNLARMLNDGRADANRYLHDSGLSLSAAWNLDFWGLYRNQTNAARAELLATEWGRRITVGTVVESVASSYLQLRTLDEELEITRQTVAARKQSLELTRTLEAGGSASLADVRQAEELLHTAEAAVPDLERQIQQQENLISVLLGRDPGSIARPAAAAEWPEPDAVPAGIPSELLERRPDIQRAEAELKAANANVGVARARLFPQFSLSDSGGTLTSQLRTLANGKSLYGTASGNLAQVIFDGGKLRNNVRLSEAEKEERVYVYQKTIKEAYRSVSDALIAAQKDRECTAKEEELVEAAKDATRLARLRYESGATSYLEVLTTDTSLYSARMSLVEAHHDESLSVIRLYSALGGGWRE
jgi:multidrug efflux system outer membrane protein